MKKTVVKDTPWISLMKITDKRYPEMEYFYTHENRCNSKSVVILPYRLTKEGFEFLLRKELVPAWNMEKQSTTCVTGGVEKEDIIYSALLELKEEAGYTIKKDALINLGKFRASKSSDNTYFAFSCDLTNVKKGDADGDGSILEKIASCFWSKNIDSTDDGLSSILYHKLVNKLSKK